MKSLHLYLAGLLVAASCAHLTAAMGGNEPRIPETETFATKIIWADEEREQPIFIPQAVLQGAKIDSLPMDRDDRSFLQDEINLRKGFGPHCGEPRFSSKQGASPSAGGFQELIAEAPASFLGTIVSIESGWAVARGLVAELAYIEVGEVVAENREGSTPRTGSVVAVLFLGGKAIIADTTFCQKNLMVFLGLL